MTLNFGVELFFFETSVLIFALKEESADYHVFIAGHLQPLFGLVTGTCSYGTLWIDATFVTCCN